MGNQIVVSVIIPVYNREILVHRAIESVMSQTYQFWELIIVDDGSTDGTLDSLKSYAKDQKVSLLTIDHCGFPGMVRNRGAEIAKGEWLAFLDSDDFWREDKLERQLQQLSHSNAQFCHSYEEWNRSGKIISQKHRKHKKEGDLFEVSLGKCEIGPSTVLMKKSLFQQLDGFREDLEICEDYEFWLRVTDRVEVVYINEPLIVKHAGHDDQLSFKYGYIEIFKIQALKKLVDHYPFASEHKELAREELARKFQIYSSGCRKRGREDEALFYEKLYFSYSHDDEQSSETT